MVDCNHSHEQDRRDDGHDRWLAMQSAHAEYRQASEALECIRRSSGDLSLDERARLTMLEGQQRIAFECYLEARMEFLEFRFDETNRLRAGLVTVPMRDPEYTGIGSWLAFANRRPVLQILALLLLCTTAFSFVRERKHVRDLEAARDEMRATVNQTRDELKLLTQKLDAWGPPQTSVIQTTEHTPRAQAATSRVAIKRKPSGAGQSRQKQVAASQGIGARSTYPARRHSRRPT
jgi:hypothetical protein